MSEQLLAEEDLVRIVSSMEPPVPAVLGAVRESLRVISPLGKDKLLETVWTYRLDYCPDSVHIWGARARCTHSFPVSVAGCTLTAIMTGWLIVSGGACTGDEASLEVRRVLTAYPWEGQ